MLSPVKRGFVCSALLLAVVLSPGPASAANAKAELTISFLVLDAQGEKLNEAIEVDPKKPTCIVVHGFTGWTRPGDWERLENHAKAWRFKYPAANVVLVKWDVPPPPGLVIPILAHYKREVELSPQIGARIAEWMTEKKIPPSKTVISGHSLGAHIAGYAGKAFSNNVDQPLRAIVATDPAGLLFFDKAPQHRLDKSDAARVIVIHTTETLGCARPLGTMDLYCVFHVVGAEPLGPEGRHRMARELVTQTLLEPDRAPVAFLASALEFNFEAGEQLATRSGK